MSSFRKERVAEEIRRIISEKFMRSGELIPDVMLTVNRVVVTPDLAIARVYYSAFGKDVEQKELDKLLKERRSEFRHAVAQKLPIKRAPQIQFCFDKNIEYAARIEGLLQQTSRQEAAAD